MPFKSESQRRYLFATHPNIAKEWSDKYGSKPVEKVRAKKLSKKTKDVQVQKEEDI